jgi:hypothetical protein
MRGTFAIGLSFLLLGCSGDGTPKAHNTAAADIVGNGANSAQTTEALARAHTSKPSEAVATSRPSGCERMVGSWVDPRRANPPPVNITANGSTFLITQGPNEFAGRCVDGNRLEKEIGSDLTYIDGDDAILYASRRFVRVN